MVYFTTRRVEFSRQPIGIQANVFILNGGIQGHHLATIAGQQISVEMESTSQKTNRMVIAKERNQDFNPLSDQTLDQLTAPQQNGILQLLKPNGSKEIEIIGDVACLRIFDPS